MRVNIEAGLSIGPVKNYLIFLRGVEVGMHAVDCNGNVRLVDVIPSFADDEDFVRGRIRGICVAFLCGVAKPKETSRVVRGEGRPTPQLLGKPFRGVAPAARRVEPSVNDEGELDTPQLNFIEEFINSR